MPRDRTWSPTLRCVQCRRVKLKDAVKAWIMQPVTPDGGVLHFVCRDCRPPEVRQRWHAKRPPSRGVGPGSGR